MSIVASELVAYASANMPDVDTGTNGGAIDTTRRIDWTQMSANDTIQAVSTSASDTQNLTITARNAAGAVVTETKAMNGTTAITFSVIGTVERVLQAELASAAIGTITVRRTTGPVTLRTIAVGERGFMALFRKTASDPAVQKDYFTKIFLKNTNATLSLLSALVKQSADPDSRITHTLAAAVNDSVTAADRLTAPSGTFDDSDKAVPGTDLAAGASIGVWLRLRLPAADPVHRTTYDVALSGQTA